MLIYSRKISFIDYYINGIKSGNIGIIRQRVTGEGICFTVQILGLEKWRNGKTDISVGNSKSRKKIFDLELEGGKGNIEYLVTAEVLRDMADAKIILELGNDCYGIAELCDLPQAVKIADEKELQASELQCVSEAVRAENEGASEQEAVQTEDESVMEEVLEECMELQPDKWEVIKKKYPILYPFKGQGPYVSIKPVDLQLLNNKYHHLCDNSYLMHGFYQYRHMILGEYSQEKGTFFYVGVPGAFVKKEQTSAAMFGFEGYEHSGDLGYYLYRVEL